MAIIPPGESHPTYPSDDYPPMPRHGDVRDVPPTSRRINLDALKPVASVRPHKITYTLALEEVEKAIAVALNLKLDSTEFNWKVTEYRDSFDRVTTGHRVHSVDVTVKQ